MTRRELVRLGVVAAASGMLGSRVDTQSLTPAARAVDHLLLGVPDLDSGIAWVEKMTGVKAAIGGSHPGRGTRNALLSLGRRQYLEIIAPDPAQAAFTFQIDLRKLAAPRLVNWAAASTNVESLAKQASAAGQQTMGPRDGSRVTPDGKTLEWRTLGVVHKLATDDVDPIPFFIEWAAGTMHPSQSAPGGCELESLAIEHPAPAPVAATLKPFGIEGPVRRYDRVRLVATLRTPKGKVELMWTGLSRRERPDEWARRTLLEYDASGRATRRRSPA